MAQKYFYVVDHYVPFPSSEYGGIWNVIAESNEEYAYIFDNGVWECYDLHYNEPLQKPIPVDYPLRENVS